MKFPTILAVAALSAVLTFAQGPGGREHRGGTPPTAEQRIGMRVDFLARMLSLTDDQKTKATSIFSSADAQAQSVRTSLQNAHQLLSDAVKKNDANGIDQASNTIGSLTGQLTAIDSKADAAFYAILTPDQQAKYPARRGGFGGPGPGGRGFPPAR